MGKTTRAYTLPKYAPPSDPADAVDEYEEAAQEFAQYPDSYRDSEVLLAAQRIREKAQHYFDQHLVPVVPLSRLSKPERRILPALLRMFPNSFLLRGESVGRPEPQHLVDDEEGPIDSYGLNLWVRHRVDGNDFCDWKKSAKLNLAAHWAKEDAETPPAVPA